MSTIDNINEKLDSIRQQYDDAVRAIREEGGLKDIFNEFFEKNPQFKALHWTQYVPYFMDGDPCEFGVNDIFVALEGAELNSDNWVYRSPEDEYNWNYATDFTATMIYDWNTPGRPKVENKNYNPDLNAIEQFIYKNSDLLEQLFGSHASVLVTPEKIAVSEYTDHD